MIDRYKWFFFKKKILLLKIWRLTWILLRSGGHISKYPPYVVQFEEDFAAFIGCKFGMSFCNGSSALEAALFAVGVRPGDEVLVSSCTIHATAAAILSLGAQPVYVDIDASSLNMAAGEIDKKVTDKTKCILVVHLWGNPADMMSILEKARKYNLKVVEDCSHVHGAKLNGQKMGTFGDIGCFSLQGYKAISAVEGGIALTDNETYYHRLTLFGHFGRNVDAVNETVYSELLPTGIDTKRRANPLGICLAAVDLQYIDQKNKFKQHFISHLKQLLARIEGIEIISVMLVAEQGGFFPGYPVVVAEGFEKEKVLAAISKKLKPFRALGRPKFFKPPQPHYHQMRHMFDLAYRDRIIYGQKPEGLPGTDLPILENTEKLLARVIVIPLG